MKSLDKLLVIITVLSVACIMQSCAQKTNSEKAPEKVLSAFNEKFPDAQKVEWEMEDEMEWEAEFKMNGKAYSANFNTNGDWKETEFEIKASELPADIRSILDQNFENYEIKVAEIAETASGESYEFEIEVDEEEFEVVIDTSGKLTKKKTSEENDQD